MFKKLLLATLIVIIGMSAAGYDIVAIKDDILNTADKQAGTVTGRSQSENSDWGADAI